MKKFIYKAGLFAIGLATVLTSCEEDTVTYNGENFVSFTAINSTNSNVKENVGTAVIPVNLAYPLSSDLVVNFTLTSEVAVPGTHYNLPATSVTIPAGATTANIEIEIIDNEEVDESRPLFLTLTNVSDASVAVGLAEQGSKYKRILIINDDCTTEFGIWLGNLNLTADNGFTGPVIGDVNSNGDCNILLLDGVIHPGIGTPDGPITFTFSPSSVGSTRGTVSAREQVYQAKGYEEGGVEYDIMYTATGTYNELTGALVITSHAYISLGNFADRIVTLRAAQ